MIRSYPAIEKQTRALISSLLDLVFPLRCVSCRTLGSRICGPCQGSIVWIDADQCPRCGTPQPEIKSHHCIDPERIRFIRSAAVFSGAMRKALHALKYRSDRPLAEKLVWMAHRRWNLPAWDFDALLPIPLGRRREQARGYNQSLLLAEALSRLTGIPVDTRSLTRARETRSQVGLSYLDRKQNMAGAFQASGPVGRNLLLVDDVCTTGATLQSCAETLMQAGTASVGAVTLARAIVPDRRRN